MILNEHSVGRLRLITEAGEAKTSFPSFLLIGVGFFSTLLSKACSILLNQIHMLISINEKSFYMQEEHEPEADDHF